MCRKVFPNAVLTYEAKSLLRRQLKTQPIQTEIGKFQNRIRGAKTTEELLGILKPFLNKFITLLSKFTPEATFLTALRFALRLLVFKYLKFDKNTRLGLYHRLIIILIQSLTRSTGGEKR